VNPRRSEKGVTMLQITCPYCEKDIELPDERRGQPARCPLCEGMFRAPLADHEPATGVRRRGGAWADAVVIAGAAIAVVGMLATAGLVLLQVQGGSMPVSTGVLRALVFVPITIIAASWALRNRIENVLFFHAARFAGYLWILCLMVLLLKMI
jgi:hypothetical protein